MLGKNGKLALFQIFIDKDWHELGLESLPELSEAYLEAITKGDFDSGFRIKLDEMTVMDQDIKVK